MNALRMNTAALVWHGYRMGGHRGAEGVLLLAGLVFAALLVWAIQSSGRRAA